MPIDWRAFQLEAEALGLPVPDVIFYDEHGLPLPVAEQHARRAQEREVANNTTPKPQRKQRTPKPRKVFIPTPQEIAQGTAAIRSTWNARELRRRAPWAHSDPLGVTIVEDLTHDGVTHGESPPLGVSYIDARTLRKHRDQQEGGST